MTSEEGYQRSRQLLREKFGEGEGLALTRLILERVSGGDKNPSLILPKEPDTDQCEQFRIFAERVLNDEPVQYVLGSAWFADMLFEVGPAVLIPRPETEELVHWVIRDHKPPGTSIRILDIGTGSGCIAIALKKKLPEARIEGIDKSSAALQIAERNAVHLSTLVDFSMLDFLDPASTEGLPRYDILISNPPYIPAAESESMPAHVTRHEPGSALFVPDEDPLIFYRAICRFAEKNLSERGMVYLEINENLGRQTAALFTDAGFQTSLRKDMQGKDRMIRAWR